MASLMVLKIPVRFVQKGLHQTTEEPSESHPAHGRDFCTIATVIPSFPFHSWSKLLHSLLWLLNENNFKCKGIQNKQIYRLERMIKMIFY